MRAQIWKPAPLLAAAMLMLAVGFGAANPVERREIAGLSPD